MSSCNMLDMVAVYPFTAILGQEDMKLALLLNAVNPRIGGVLVRGEKGTAKSTAVRALAALLPQIEVFRGCPLETGPDEENLQCGRCRLCLPPRAVEKRRVQMVTLPLNATEDRVVGGIDFDGTMKAGRRVMQPGLLARAHRGILYVDEVNLLDDHLVDAILDAAASGENRIEREGISFSHPSRFVLVGTMNPEEGELRPQLLDRFGLCVEVQAVREREQRTAMMLNREAFDADPQQFACKFERESGILARKLLAATQALRDTIFPGGLRHLVAELCVEACVAGHRADLVMEQAALALAALEGRNEVSREDLLRVAPMVLLHRRRETAPPPPPPQHKHEPNDHSHDDPPEAKSQQEQQETDTPGEMESQRSSGRDGDPKEAPVPDASENTEHPMPQPQKNAEEKTYDIGDTFKVKRFSATKDRTFRRGSGRRSRTLISGRQGRYVKSVQGTNTGDVAFDATLRAAAPYQKRRKASSDLAVVLKPQDIREKVRERRIGNFLLFVVDASGSMGARGRMAATKGAIMSLLLDAYQKRDKVAMISFNKSEARVALPPTSSMDSAARLLAELPVGGRTPLSAGLVKSHELLRGHLLRDPTSRPIVILITDGRSNVPLGRGKPMEESVALAGKLAMDEHVRFIVVDTEDKGLLRFDMASRLASALSAQYFQTKDLKADTLVGLVKGVSSK